MNSTAVNPFPPPTIHNHQPEPAPQTVGDIVAATDRDALMADIEVIDMTPTDAIAAALEARRRTRERQTLSPEFTARLAADQRRREVIETFDRRMTAFGGSRIGGRQYQAEAFALRNDLEDAECIIRSQRMTARIVERELAELETARERGWNPVRIAAVRTRLMESIRMVNADLHEMLERRDALEIMLSHASEQIDARLQEVFVRVRSAQRHRTVRHCRAPRRRQSRTMARTSARGSGGGAATGDPAEPDSPPARRTRSAGPGLTTTPHRLLRGASQVFADEGRVL